MREHLATKLNEMRIAPVARIGLAVEDFGLDPCRSVAQHDDAAGEQERLLVCLMYVHGLKPSEVCAGYARLFPSVEDVYRVKRNLLERLRRNRRLRASYTRGQPAC